jgi:ankyrin repeat protein
MIQACYSGDIKKVNRLIDYCSLDTINEGLQGACHGGHKNLVDFLISKGANDWGRGLYGACQGGHRELVELMISKGASSWDWGLGGACEGGHRELIDLMISKGSNDLNTGLWHAHHYGHIDICELMISRGTKYSEYDGLVLWISRKREVIDDILGSDISSIVTKYLWP